MTDNIKELLEKALQKAGSEAELLKQTKLSRATLWRMRQGRFNFHAESIAKLLRYVR